ncbi:MAG TPA: Glu/Leu/Phe/Val dehydrogenase dimerization domain-containing protein [Actinomycetes bacterium]|nr:Glu/Leu/Phe/Val dehydrogenase dimerization domain-containing protein [Actinomycetes bacterium]
MSTHDSYLELTWTDEVTGIKGYVVIDTLSRGVAGGGLRMRRGVTVDEVRDLAQAMTLKEAVVYTEGDRYVPLGGAKAGIDCDPYDPRAREVLGRFGRAMKPLIQTLFATGEDFGVRQDVIDEVFADEGIRSSAESALALVEDGADAAHDRLKEAFSVDVDGVGLGELVGGYGVAETALAALEFRGTQPATATAVVQGFGSMGGATARYLARAGVRVIGVADRDGLIYNQAGLDVERLLAVRDPFGVIDRNQLVVGDELRPGEDWIGIDADLLVPAAMSYVITPDNVEQVKAGVIAEAANVATLPEAEQRLLQRGVTVVPDFVANVGTNAWWWWIAFADIEPTAQASFAKISSVLRPLTTELLQRARREGISPRKAATAISEEKRAAVARLYPTSVKSEAVAR